MNRFQYLTEIDKKLAGRDKIKLSKEGLYKIVNQVWELGRQEGLAEKKANSTNDLPDFLKDLFK